MSLSLKIDNGAGPIRIAKFPAGESLVSLEFIDLNDEVTVDIELIFQSNDDLINLLLLTDAVRRYYRTAHIHLTMPYLPYARQDRVCNPGESLSVKVITDLINSQNYSSVTCYDIHSDVGVALINNLRHVTWVNSNTTNLRIFRPPEKTLLVSPDAGSNKKVDAFAKAMGYDQPIRADKKRDVHTGEITGTVVYSYGVGDKDLLIMDDICDGGRTFIELAKVLRPLTSGTVSLYVTHGLFTKGYEVFDGVLDHIFCANLMAPKNKLVQEI